MAELRRARCGRASDSRRRSVVERRWAPKLVLALADTAAWAVALAGSPGGRRRRYERRSPVTRGVSPCWRSRTCPSALVPSRSRFAGSDLCTPRVAVRALAVGVGVVTLEREIARMAFGRLRRRGRLLCRVLIVGANLGISRMVATRLATRLLGHRLVGDDPTAPPDFEGSRHSAAPTILHASSGPLVRARRDRSCGDGLGQIQPAHPRAHRRRHPRRAVINAP